ncbi:MAG TPA: vanadium-dependent haloperoxidase, partial [Thermoanaerobaculia bacterium]|nr:vanadium-dependent haloperoxidase [Thermoanaerobaculia bacterium]
GIRTTKPGPTIAARALAVAHTAMFDAWAAYDAQAVPTRPHRDWRRPAPEATAANRAKAVSFAGWRAARDLFPSDSAAFDALMTQQGYDIADASLDPATPAGVGNLAAETVLAWRHGDGSNQLGDLHPGAYSDYTGYVPVNTPTTVIDPNRWQPLLIVNDSGQIVAQTYTTPHWGLVVPFAMASGSEHRPPGPVLWPDPEYRAQADELISISAGLTDLQKVTAEYFADGPSSEFPPGHWALFAQFVSRRDLHTLDADVKMFFALGNALLDASICGWDAKRAYDSVRPITAIRYLYAGVPISSWGGPFQGTQLIPGDRWRPYQLGTVVTPPFPEFFSGHSVYSAAGAEILKTFTGSDTLGFSVLIPRGSSRAEPGLVPAADLTLSWATFSEAADAAGMSRRYGGIHFRLGDLTGRAAGRGIGQQSWAKAQTYIDGTAAVPLDRARPRSHSAVTIPPR